MAVPGRNPCHIPSTDVWQGYLLLFFSFTTFPQTTFLFHCATDPRLGRSLKDLIETLIILKDRNVDFISLTEKIDTTTPGGKLIFHLMGALAEFERDLIRERTNAGLAAARARGRIGGRPKKLATNGKVALARRLFADPNQSIPEICSTLEISRSTLYRYVKEATPSASDS